MTHFIRVSAYQTLESDIPLGGRNESWRWRGWIKWSKINKEGPGMDQGCLCHRLKKRIHSHLWTWGSKIIEEQNFVISVVGLRRHVKREVPGHWEGKGGLRSCFLLHLALYQVFQWGLEKAMLQGRGQQTFSVGNCRENIVGSAGHAVSMASTQLPCRSEKTTTDDP